MPSAGATKKLTRSLEDYLEAILLLIRQGRVARVRDIAASMGVSMPSVTAALRALSKRGLVNYDPYQVITLSDAGTEQAERISQRHHVLRSFLTDVLALDADAAEANACRIEHAIDDELLRRLRDFSQFLRSCPRGGADWLEAFKTFCRGGHQPHCRECIDAVKNKIELKE